MINLICRIFVQELTKNQVPQRESCLNVLSIPREKKEEETWFDKQTANVIKRYSTG